MPDWVWDRAKDHANRRKHGGISLADGVLALDDPHALSVPDPHPDDNRWRTLGFAGEIALLFVVHTEPVDQNDGREIGRIISVRKAKTQERKAYADGLERGRSG